MWLAISIYNDGGLPEFKKGKTKKEVVNWLRGMGYNEPLDRIINGGENVTFQHTAIDYHTAYVVNLDAKK